MKRLAIIVVACFPLVLTGCGGNADKIIGVWIVTKSDGKEVPKEAKEFTFEFTKDGKMKVLGLLENEYKVDGDKLIVTTKNEKGEAKTNTVLIKKLDGDDMIIYDEEKKSEMELKRKK